MQEKKDKKNRYHNNIHIGDNQVLKNIIVGGDVNYGDFIKEVGCNSSDCTNVSRCSIRLLYFKLCDPMGNEIEIGGPISFSFLFINIT